MRIFILLVEGPVISVQPAQLDTFVHIVLKISLDSKPNNFVFINIAVVFEEVGKLMNRGLTDKSSDLLNYFFYYTICLRRSRQQLSSTNVCEAEHIILFGGKAADQS